MPFYQKPLVANERNNQRRKAYSHATTKDKEIRAGNRERGKPLKIQYIIGCVAEDGASAKTELAT